MELEIPTRCSVLVIGAGISGITVAKLLADNGVGDVLILEAEDRIGGRIRKEKFGGVTVELGAGWIAGVGGKQSNPVWELARNCNLRTCFSDYSNARYNIYDRSGKIFPSGVAAESYQRAVESAIQKLQNNQHYSSNNSNLSEITPNPAAPKTPIELAIDFILHDFEMAEVEPIATYVDFGEREYLVTDERGYEHLVYKIAETFLSTAEGKILDHRLKLNKVVRELQQSRDGVRVKTEDGTLYETRYVILSVSIGVLQTQLISFIPPLPKWKTQAIMNCDIMVYTKVFLKFPTKFWPCGPGKEFFIFAHERRGYYTFWQHMENAYPGSNILVVTLTNSESKRIEAQSDQQTKKEAMEVLRSMFGSDIPDATEILVPHWWSNRFQCGSYTNYPIYGNHQLIDDIKAPIGRIFFTGEHTSENFSGYVHGGYLSGLDTGKALLEEMKSRKEEKNDEQSYGVDPLLVGGALPQAQADNTISNIHKFEIPR